MFKQIIKILVLVLVLSNSLCGADQCTPCYTDSVSCDSNMGACVDPSKACLPKNQTTNLCQTRIKVGGDCISDTDCVFGASCLTGKCQNVGYLGLNEKGCSTDNDCSTGLQCNQWCSDDGRPCYGMCESYGSCQTGSFACGYNKYCSDSQVCENSIGLGGVCGTDIKCKNGLVCSTQGTCVNEFTGQLGDSCSEDPFCDFSKSLYCAADGTCQSSTLTNQSIDCISGTNVCKQNIEYCDCSGKCQTMFYANPTCLKVSSNLRSCIVKNSCQPVDNMMNPKSCAMIKCSIEMCQFVKNCTPGPCGVSSQAVCTLAVPPKPSIDPPSSAFKLVHLSTGTLLILSIISFILL